MLRERTIRYKGKDIIVYFTIDRCTHVAECIKGAPDVFDSTRKPWIIADAAPADHVAEVCMRCPTGALHFKRTDGGSEETRPDHNRIHVCEDGPLNITGDLKVLDSGGELLIEDTRLALCSCGASKIKPFCDGAHDLVDFKQEGLIPEDTKQAPDVSAGELRIRLAKNGPLLLKGPFEMTGRDGEVTFKGERAALCRCGKSQTMPFCDGSHTQTGFQTEIYGR